MNEKTNNPYEANATMKQIGAQDRASIIAKLRGGMDDIAAARPYTTTHETAIDFMIYGYLQGQQAERERKFPWGGGIALLETEKMIYNSELKDGEADGADERENENETSGGVDDGTC